MTIKNTHRSMVYKILMGVLIVSICAGGLWALTLLVKEQKQTPDGFLNPGLDTKIGKNIMKTKNINLEYELKDYTQEKINQGSILDLSVYFRDLNNGNWFGVGEKEMFSPASLMKLPLLLIYFKRSETDKGFLEQKIIFTANGRSAEYKQNIAPTTRLEDGQEYTIMEILEQMVIYSDNEASLFLESQIQVDDFRKVFLDVGIAFPPILDDKFDNNIRVNDFASFFRVLFNASYLNRENSQKVLQLLTKTAFKDGLVAGVNDTDMIISHKFGERSIFGNNGIERMQLHDCGIVYYPQHPYILCMMTRGYERNQLKTTLQEVSSMVYQNIDQTYRKQ